MSTRPHWTMRELFTAIALLCIGMALVRVVVTPSDPRSQLQWTFRFLAYFAAWASIGAGIGTILRRIKFSIIAGLSLALVAPVIFLSAPLRIAIPLIVLITLIVRRQQRLLQRIRFRRSLTPKQQMRMDTNTPPPAFRIHYRWITAGILMLAFVWVVLSPLYGVLEAEQAEAPFRAVGGWGEYYGDGMGKFSGPKGMFLVYLPPATQLDDASLERLRPAFEALPNLQILILNGTRITDAGLPAIQNLKTLESIHLADTAVTDKGVARLKSKLPNCQIFYGGPDRRKKS